MKNIQPIQIWKDGQLKQVSILEARIIYDDLTSSCTFYYELKTSNLETGEKVSEGNVFMKDLDYTSWDGSNEAAYSFVTQQLNLTLL